MNKDNALLCDMAHNVNVQPHLDPDTGQSGNAFPWLV